MTKKERGARCEPFYVIKINVPEHGEGSLSISELVSHDTNV